MTETNIQKINIGLRVTKNTNFAEAVYTGQFQQYLLDSYGRNYLIILGMRVIAGHMYLVLNVSNLHTIEGSFPEGEINALSSTLRKGKDKKNTFCNRNNFKWKTSLN